MVSTWAVSLQFVMMETTSKWFHYLLKTFWNVNQLWKPAKKDQELNKLSFASNQ